MTLTKHVFLNAKTSAEASDWYSLDFRYNGDAKRTIIGTKAIDDVILIEVKNQVIKAGTTIESVSTTESVGSAVTAFDTALQGQFTHIRIRKVGTNGAATVVGVV